VVRTLYRALFRVPALGIGNIAGNKDGNGLLRSHAGDKGASIIAVEEFEMEIAEPDEFHVRKLIECG